MLGADARAILRALLAAVEQRTAVSALPVAAAEVVAIARKHRLSPLLSTLDPSGLDAAVMETFRRDRLVTVARNTGLALAAEDCVRALAAASVPVILLKGLAYEQTIYPGVGARPTSDVDLLVPGEARRTAFAVLNRLGFQPRAASPGFDEADYHEVAWHRNGVDVDLHLALAPLARCRIDYVDVWTRARRPPAGGMPSDALVLDDVHAAVFHALHMAIDHFDVPALYLLDLARLLPEASDVQRAEEVARAWRCGRSFATARALAAAFLPAWRARQPLLHAGATPWFSQRIVDHYGGAEPVSRREQLVRKLTHLDSAGYAVRYVAIQARRNAREVLERRIRRRSARERLALDRDA
jgi:hypothetical protein